LAIWGIVAAFLWTSTALRIADLIQRGFDLLHLSFADAALVAGHVVLFLLFVPLVYLTALFILGVFGLGQMVDHVAATSFATLERRHGGGGLGSAWRGVC